ncbi:MAG: sensor histidine kinase [Pseudomonadales bacterium]
MPANSSLKRTLLGFAGTITFCLAIGVLLWALGITELSRAVTISLCVGISINAMFELFHEQLKRHLSPTLAPIPLQIAGLALGLVTGAWLTVGDPWYFFSHSEDTLWLGLFFGVVGYMLFGARSRLVDSQAQLAQAQQQQAEQDRQMADTQLKLLQAQIEPHFLFNTLSNATSLIRTDPQAAEATLEHLTLLLRASLKRTRERHTTLGEEVDMLTAYLNIQHIRMGSRLQFHIDVPGTLRSQQLPPLLLQPLVENAVNHGLEPKAEGGTVSISATSQDNSLQLKVIDTGLGIHPDNLGAPHNRKGTGTALSNIKKRLSALYGAEAQLTLADNEPSGVIAELRLPLSAA